MMGGNEIFEVIKKRRSIRKFEADKSIPIETIKDIISAGSFAPSGHNNQPWRFVVIKDKDMKTEVSRLTAYGSIVKSADTLIAVFINHPASYDRDKDLMAIGACIQNMLIYISSLGLGAVWLGEILKNKDRVRDLLKISSDNELIAVIALGYPAHSPKSPGRKSVEELILNVY
ncbi:MAG: nitroreductase family protein [Proteobacteria bacterium]|nr:nitroreductase family protein [Pseudomonadota bacterium]